MKLLALDIGGVCLRLTPERVFQSMNLNPDNLPEGYNKAYHDYSVGKIGSWQFGKDLQAIVEQPMTVAQIHDAWMKFLDTEDFKTTRLLEALWERNWHIVFFSDTQPWHIEGLRDILSYSKRIPDAIYSCDIGAEKPSDAMFEAFEARYGKPDLYLDDRLCNIEGGLRHGWNAVLFKETTAEELLTKLKA
jgi:FMN phosphatase YigB (HAD superfamily)